MSIQFKVVRTFRVPQKQAYEALLNLEMAKEWMQGLVSMERLDEGEMRVGSQWKETREMFGKQATEVFEVVELKEYEKIILFCDGKKGSTGKGEYLYTYLIKEIGDASEITLTGEIKGLTGLTKLLGKYMKRIFEKAIAKDLDALKIFLEK